MSDLIVTINSNSGASKTVHRSHDQLVHNIAETSIEERIKVLGKISKVTLWQTSSKLKRIRESRLTRTSGKVTEEIYEQYAEDGITILETLTITIPRTAGVISGDIIRTLT